MSRDITLDDNLHPIPVSGQFVTEQVTLTGTAFTDNDVDIPDNVAEVTIKSSDNVEIAEAVDGDGFEIEAGLPFTIGISKMDKIWLKGANDQVVELIWHKF